MKKSRKKEKGTGSIHLALNDGMIMIDHKFNNGLTQLKLDVLEGDWKRLWNMIENFNEPQKMYYYILGTEAVDMYINNGIEMMISEMKNDSSVGTIYSFNQDEHPDGIMGAVDGWGNFHEITDREYTRINNMLNPKIKSVPLALQFPEIADAVNG